MRGRQMAIEEFLHQISGIWKYTHLLTMGKLMKMSDEYKNMCTKKKICFNFPSKSNVTMCTRKIINSLSYC